MSLVPEFIIQQTLVKGFRVFRENPDLVRMLFRNVEQESLQDLVEFLKDSTVDICINYPDKDLVLPMIAIILGSEAETDTFLGELQEGAQAYRQEAPFPQEQILGDQTVLGGGSVSNVGGGAAQGNLLLIPTTAEGGSSTTVTAPADTTILIDPYEEDEVYVETIEGTGAGQRRLVTSITPSLAGGPVIIEIDSAWATIPDNTTVFSLRGPRKLAGTGEPSKLFTPGDNIERKGQIYEARYRLDIIAKPQELAIYLYSMTKAILIVAHQSLLAQGFIYLTLGGADLGPLPEFYPSLAYRRTLSLSFKYAFDVFAEMSQEVASEISIALAVHDPDVDDYEDVDLEVSVTSVNIP
jgi:hypothetical protein